MKSKILYFFVLVATVIMITGCTAMNNAVSQSSSMTSVMQNFTVQALKIDVDPTTIKIISDDASSSYISGSNWFAELPDGRKYKCNKMRREDTFCVKIKNLPVAKSTSVPAVSTEETKKEQEPAEIKSTQKKKVSKKTATKKTAIKKETTSAN